MEPLHFISPVELQAAAAGSPVKVAGLLYGGGMLRLPGWGTVVIDLAGMAIPESLTLLVDHINSVGAVAGSATVIKTTKQVNIKGTLATSPAGEAVATLLREGVALQMSVGVEVLTTQFLRNGGEKVKVNGQTIAVPANGLTLIQTSKLREGTITPLGADDSTSLKIAAMRGGKQLMDFETYVKNLGLDPAGLSDAQRTALQAKFSAAGGGGSTVPLPIDPLDAERKRIAYIVASFPDDAAMREQAISVGYSIEQVDRVCLERLRASRPKVNAIGPRGGSSSTIHTGGDVQSILTAALMIRAGYESAGEKALGAQTMQRARDLRCRSLMDIVQASLQLSGVETPMGQNEMIRAGFSTTSLPVALGQSGEKIAIDAYNAYPATWRQIAKPVNVKNFKEHQVVKMSQFGTFQKIGADGELKSGSLGENVFASVRAQTGGVIFVLTRQHIIDDDLSLFDGIPAGIGQMGATMISDDIWSAIMGNADDFYHEDNGNYIEGADTNLSIPALETALRAMREQTDENGKSIDILPAVLAVPPALEFTARQLLSSATLARDVSSDDQLPEGNPVPKDLQLIVEPRLGNVAYTGSGSKIWYLFAAPMSHAAVHVGFLNGNQSPIVETVDVDMDKLGIAIRGYLDAGVGLGDPKASVKSKGEA